MSLGLLRNPEGHGFPGSRNLKEYASAHNAEIITGSGMHWGIVVAFIAVIFAYILLNRHMLGFHIKLTGQAPRAARLEAGGKELTALGRGLYGTGHVAVGRRRAFLGHHLSGPEAEAQPNGARGRWLGRVLSLEIPVVANPVWLRRVECPNRSCVEEE